MYQIHQMELHTARWATRFHYYPTRLPHDGHALGRCVQSQRKDTTRPGCGRAATLQLHWKPRIYWWILTVNNS